MRGFVIRKFLIDVTLRVIISIDFAA